MRMQAFATPLETLLQNKLALGPLAFRFTCCHQTTFFLHNALSVLHETLFLPALVGQGQTEHFENQAVPHGVASVCWFQPMKHPHTAPLLFSAWEPLHAATRREAIIFWYALQPTQMKAMMKCWLGFEVWERQSSV